MKEFWGKTLENMMLSERSQRPAMVRFHSYEMSRTDKSIRTEDKLVVARAGREEWGVTANPWGLVSFQDENILELLGVVVAQHCRRTACQQTVHLTVNG